MYVYDRAAFSDSRRRCMLLFYPISTEKLCMKRKKKKDRCVQEDGYTGCESPGMDSASLFALLLYKSSKCSQWAEIRVAQERWEDSQDDLDICDLDFFTADGGRTSIVGRIPSRTDVTLGMILCLDRWTQKQILTFMKLPIPARML